MDLQLCIQGFVGMIFLHKSNTNVIPGECVPPFSMDENVSMDDKPKIK